MTRRAPYLKQFSWSGFSLFRIGFSIDKVRFALYLGPLSWRHYRKIENPGYIRIPIPGHAYYIGYYGYYNSHQRSRFHRLDLSWGKWSYSLSNNTRLNRVMAHWRKGW
jgi:hypothetical protein